MFFIEQYNYNMQVFQLNDESIKYLTIDDIDNYLEILKLDYQQINEIDINRTFLRGMIFLTEWPFPEQITGISFSNNQLIRLPDLTAFKNLKNVNINMNKDIMELGYLKNNINLTYLSAIGCQIKDINGIINSRNSLKSVNLSGNKLTDVSVFYNYQFPNLTDLFIKNNPLLNKESLKNLIIKKNKNIKNLVL